MCAVFSKWVDSESYLLCPTAVGVSAAPVPGPHLTQTTH